MRKKTRKNSRLSSDFGPLQKPRSLNEVVYENLKNAILEGKLEAGEMYSELELAGELGVSRTPVREALLRLQAEKFVVFHSRRGVSVNYFTRKDIENLFELRRAVEEAIVPRLVENLNQDQIEAARRIISEQEECAGSTEYDENLFLEIDRKFHLFLLDLSGNRFVAQTYANIRDYVTITARKALLKSGRTGEVINEHKAILDALCEKNIQKVREAIQQHLTASRVTAVEGRPLEGELENERRSNHAEAGD